MKRGWQRKKLGEVCEVITKGTTPTSLGFQFTDEGINFIKVESLTESGQIIPKKVAYISKECHEALKRSQLRANDILFSIAGALGRIGIVNEEIVPANTNQALAIIRLSKNSGFLVDFLAKYFISTNISEEIERLKGGAAQQNLSLSQLSNLEIPFPPLPEQKRIAAILDKAFAAIDKAKANAEQNLKNATELFKSYLLSIFSNPNDWPKLRIDEVCESIIDCVNKTAPIVNEVTPFKMIRTTNVRNGLVSLDRVNYVSENVYHVWTRRQVPKRGDVILTREAPMGEVGMLLSDESVFLGQRLVSYRVNPKKLNNKFLLYAFQSSDIQNQISALASGSTVQHMRVPDSKALQIYVPPLCEQATYVAKFEAINNYVEQLKKLNQKKLLLLCELKESILQKAFNGELICAEVALE